MGFYEPFEYEPIKQVPSARDKHPSQMRQTQGAIANPPTVTGKPAKFIGKRPRISATLDRFETPDLKNDSVRVGKCVTVGSLNCNTIDGPGDSLMTLATKYIFFFLGLRFFSLLFLDNRGLTIAPLFGRLA
jgi:hypothetical protein